VILDVAALNLLQNTAKIPADKFPANINNKIKINTTATIYTPDLLKINNQHIKEATSPINTI
jgi:hypothetical protein